MDLDPEFIVRAVPCRAVELDEPSVEAIEISKLAHFVWIDHDGRHQGAGFVVRSDMNAMPWPFRQAPLGAPLCQQRCETASILRLPKRRVTLAYVTWARCPVVSSR